MDKKQKVKDMNEYKKRKKNRNKKRKNKKKIKFILAMFSILAITITNLCGNAVVSNLKYEINNLKQDLRKEEIALDELKMEKLKNGSITNIEDKAKEKLNMDYPKNYQIRYIDMEN